MDSIFPSLNEQQISFRCTVCIYLPRSRNRTPLSAGNRSSQESSKAGSWTENPRKRSPKLKKGKNRV